MNLIIDVGNSYVKLAVFDNDQVKHKEVVEISDVVKRIFLLRDKYKSIHKLILSSVANFDTKEIRIIKESFDALILNSQTKLPFNNLYKTPKTLGVDRIALISAATKNFPNTNALVIDAGTCITYDFITNTNKYLGGAISPGLRMRYKALNNYTANLPLLDTKQAEHIIGNSTEGSIHSGVVKGTVNELEGIIEEYENKYSHLTVILTGGDAKFLSRQLKSSIFANSNFLLEGLNYILQFNSNK